MANYAYTQSEINIKIGKKNPSEYLKEAIDRRNDLSAISTRKNLLENLKAHAIPEDIMNMTYKDYESFLKKRRKLMAEKIRDYYFSL